MPELPEVEVTRRAFASQIAGARIESVALGKPLRWPLGIAPELLTGREVHSVRRRGKYLWLPLEGRPGLFPEDIDESDPWQFRNVLVR